MQFDATFWVAVSFFIFFGALIYFKIPQNVNNLLSKMIVDIKNEIDESEKLRTESKKLLDNAQSKLNSVSVETKKRSALEEDIDSEINAAEDEINKLRNTSGDKINKIAIETSSELIRQLIGEEVNGSSISAIVEDQLRKSKEKQNVV